MFDKETYHKEYRQKRKEDPEKVAKYNKQVSNSIKNKYHTDPEFRAKVIQTAKEHYNKIKQEREQYKAFYETYSPIISQIQGA